MWRITELASSSYPIGDAAGAKDGRRRGRFETRRQRSDGSMAQKAVKLPGK